MPPFKFSVTLWAFLLMFSIYMSLQDLICSIKLKIPLKSILLLINLTLFMLGYLSCFVVICWLFSIFFFKQFFQKLYQSVKWFGSRSGTTFCLYLSGSKLFVKGNFSCFVLSSADFLFSKLAFLSGTLYQNVKWFGSRSVQTVCKSYLGNFSWFCCLPSFFKMNVFQKSL